MGTPLVLLQLLVLVLLVGSSIETARSRPWWPRSPGRPASRGPARGSSPRERRWIHAGLALIVAANLLVAPAAERGWPPWLAGGLLLAGVAAVVVGFVRGPSPADRRRFAGTAAPPRGDGGGDDDRAAGGDGPERR